MAQRNLNAYHEFMTRYPDSPRRRAARVAEPVQVYLATSDMERLERLASALQATKSDVLRRGLSALEALQQRAGSPTPSSHEGLPIFLGRGLRAGVTLDDSAALLDHMDDETPRR